MPIRTENEQKFVLFRRQTTQTERIFASFETKSTCKGQREPYKILSGVRLINIE